MDHRPSANQLNFENARAFEAGPSAPGVIATPLQREISAADARRAARRFADTAGSGRGFTPSGGAPEAEAKARALADLDAMLRGFIARLNQGDEFQCADFTEWLNRSGVAPDPELVDPRVVGGLIARLAGEGLIQAGGYAMTRASAHTNAHSSPKRVWRVTPRASAAGEGAAA